MPAEAKYLEANSTADVTGFELIGQFSPPLFGGLAVITAASKDIAFAYAVSNKDWNTVLSVANTSGQPARVALAAMDINGNQLVAKTVTIAAHGYYTGSLASTFGSLPTAMAWVKASSDGAPLVGFLKLLRPSNGQFTDIPADPVSASAASSATMKTAAIASQTAGLADAAALIQTQAGPDGGVRLDWPSWLDTKVAELSGGRIHRGDTILAIHGEKVTSRQDLIRLASRWRGAPAVDVQVRSPLGSVQVIRIAVPAIGGSVTR